MVSVFRDFWLSIKILILIQTKSAHAFHFKQALIQIQKALNT